MAIKSKLFILSNSGDWRMQSTSSVEGVTKSKQGHSEYKLLENYNGNSNVMLVVQNEFPCKDCHAHLKNLTVSGSKYIVFKIVGNKGEYSCDHGLSKNASVPRIIYYHNGTSEMVTMSSRNGGPAPIGFPAHPDVENKDEGDLNF